MQTWTDLIKIANNGNPSPDQRIEKSDEEWKALLTEEQFRVTRLKGTERAGSGEFCERHEPGLYGCVCCNTPLFDSREKFDSSSGWPSFTLPVKENAIKYKKDTSHGMIRIEAMCNTCDAHQGHVFPDGPAPSGLRYCINSISMKLINDSQKEESLVVGNGCFWCTEAVFQNINGVLKVESGYSGGFIKNPAYREISQGTTGHAEVIQLTFNPDIIAYADLLRIFFTTHDPTTLNRQGYDSGTQYRSVIFFRGNEEEKLAKEVLNEMQAVYEQPIVTEISQLGAFYKADQDHQDYYNQNKGNSYCQAIIDPKLNKLRRSFQKFMKD